MHPFTSSPSPLLNDYLNDQSPNDPFIQAGGDNRNTSIWEALSSGQPEHRDQQRQSPQEASLLPQQPTWNLDNRTRRRS
jgi:hypothetical protein